MKLLLAALALVSVVLAAGEEPQELATVAPEEPLHKVLFESGYYAQALEYLDTRIAAGDTTRGQEYRTYRAFCLIMLSRHDEAVACFHEVLDRDSAFTLDPILTSPKIYEVFSVARSAWLRERRPAAGDTTAAHADAMTAAARMAAANARVDSARAVPRRDWYAVPLCLLPLGAGQFYHHEPVSGITLALLQGGCLAASIISYVKRDDHYDPRYGWYAGNAGAYRDYTTAYRIEFSVFGLAYLCGVVEALVRESRHPAAARERTR